MKKISLFFALITLLASCSKQVEPQPLAERVAGIWKVTKLDGHAVKTTDKIKFTFTKKTSTSVNGVFDINTTNLKMGIINLSESGQDIFLDSEDGLGNGQINGNSLTFFVDLSGDIYELEATKQ